MAKLTVAVSANDHVQGPEDAPVTLVEYGDYECPHCGAAYPIIKRIQKAMGADLRFVFRNFPLTESHPHALHAAQAAEAVALQDKFWEMHDVIYENQETLEDDDLLRFARALKLDTKKWAADFDANEVVSKIQGDFSSGIRSGVNGTPTFFINGIRHDDSFEYSVLLPALQRELKSSTKLKKQSKGR